MNNYEIASKMYIQLGERTKAMKALIKLGDSEKVIAFANNARMAEIYILAGNFLQSVIILFILNRVNGTKPQN